MAERRATRSRARFADDARWRADTRALERAEARQRSPPNAALYGPSSGERATQKALGNEGTLLTGGELVVANKERASVPSYYNGSGLGRLDIKAWLRNNDIDPSAVRKACYYLTTVEKLVSFSQSQMKVIRQKCDALDPQKYQGYHPRAQMRRRQSPEPHLRNSRAAPHVSFLARHAQAYSSYPPKPSRGIRSSCRAALCCPGPHDAAPPRPRLRVGLLMKPGRRLLVRRVGSVLDPRAAPHDERQRPRKHVVDPKCRSRRAHPAV